MTSKIKISKVSGQPNFEAMQVFKVIDYPLEPRDYKPYAQTRLCVADGDFIVSMWAFEAEPSRQSRLMGVFDLGAAVLAIQTSPAGGALVQRIDRGDQNKIPQSLTEQEVHIHSYMGEDLQGIYWATTVRIKKEALKNRFEVELENGTRFLGNVYKLCEDGQWTHKGSLFPAQFEPFDPYAAGNMGEIEVVDY